ncbi:MAG: DNA topoisomerase [Ruminococcus sp.]
MSRNRTGDNGADFEDVREGMELPAVAAKKTEHFTAPPKAYSEDTLLAAMETAGNKEFDKETEKKGLGTPATRASIIEKLVASKYAMRKGKQILPTAEGKELIAVLPDYLKSASMTAEWENQLLAMERGDVSRDDFMAGIKNLITMVLNGCEALPEEEKRRFREKKSSAPARCAAARSMRERTAFTAADRNVPSPSGGKTVSLPV